MGRVDQPLSAAQMRHKAEAIFSARPQAPRGIAETQALLHELGVHQVELELQNEQLREMQIELERSRDRYAALYDSAPVGYLTIDRHGAITECNLTAAEMLGQDRSRLLGRKLYSLMSSDAADAFYLQQLELRRGGGATQSCELDLKRPDGRMLRARLDSVADADIGGGPRSHVALIDMTDLRDAQADLRTSEARFRQIATHIQDVFYLRERDGAISYVNPAFEQIWGRPVSELTDTTAAWLTTVDDEDRERIKAAWERLRAGTPISELYRIHRPDGTLRWIQSRDYPVRTDDGSVIRSVGVARDVTHERMLEQALTQAQKMEAVGTLASGVAHNLRNVLQAILNFIEVMRALTVDGKPIVDMLDRAAIATRRGAVLIDQLMTFARKQGDQITLVPVHVADALREAAELIRPLLGEAIAVQMEAAAGDHLVMADPVQLERILLNLAANARDAMPSGGTLTIASGAAELDEATATAHGVSAGPYVVVTVKDTGHGMDAATQARVFEPFFTTKDVGKGTGLGLSTVFALVQRFAGFIEVDSAPDAGTRFRIYLPCLPAPSSAP